MDSFARSTLARTLPLSYMWWSSLMARLDATENDEAARKEAEGVVFDVKGYASKYEKNKFLQLAAVGFPDEFRRLAGDMWRREEGFAPKYLTKKWLDTAALRVKAAFWKEKIKEEKQMLGVMQKEHKQALQLLKELGDEEEE